MRSGSAFLPKAETSELSVLPFTFVSAGCSFLNRVLLGSQTFQKELVELPLRSQGREMFLKSSGNPDFSTCENRIMDIGS